MNWNNLKNTKDRDMEQQHQQKQNDFQNNFMMFYR